MTNYEQSNIYKLFCKNKDIKDIYIGSTNNIRRRTYQHKHNCNTKTSNKYNWSLYQFMRENGSFENWQVDIIESINCANRKQLLKKEREYIEKLKPSLNKNIPTRTFEEYNRVNKHAILQKRKELFTCECGATLRKADRCRHFRTKKHQKYSSKQNIEI
jgi:hypothetical protein